MKDPVVAISYVADGSMRNRDDFLDPAVIENREKWLQEMKLELTKATRVNITYDGDDYCRYKLVDQSDMGEGMTGDTYSADALITTTPGHVLFLPIADCVATTIFDPDNNVLMLTHLGRQSLEQQGGLKSIQYLHEHYASKPENLKIWLSPTVNKDVYPIFKLDNKGMKEAVYEQFKQAGVNFENITDNQDDTATNPDYYSYSEYLKGNKPTDGCYAMLAMLPG